MSHPLESNTTEQSYFLRTGRSERGAYRRAVQALTDSLPTWAARSVGGRSRTFDVAEAVAMYRAGATLQAVAENFGVTASAVGHHVRKAKAAQAV